MDIATLMNSSEYKRIETDIESFVKEKLSHDYNVQQITGKTIHDPIWGSIEYSDWEMQLIDSPLFQRLRDINQVGLAMLTYPAARHSRFEHSLGVAAAAKKMCEKISSNSAKFNFEQEDKDKVYLAALLHDIGHGFFSHLSERIYGEFEEFQSLLNVFNNTLKRRPKAHEALAFIIINTQTFRKFFFDKINYPNKNKCQNYLFSDVGKMIIGSNIEKDNRVYSYLTAIINGPFDVDKLDYIKRDSHTAGLSLSYDMERLFTKVAVHDMNNNTFPEYGMLQLKDLASKIEHRQLPKRCFEISHTNVESICTNTSFDLKQQCKNLHKKFEEGLTVEELQSQIEMLTSYLMRSTTRENPVLYDLLMSELRDATFEQLLDLRKGFYDALVKEYKEAGRNVNFGIFDVYIIFPKSVHYGAAEEDVILGRDNDKLLKINDFVNLDDWAASFNSNKWRGYVFVSEHIDRTIAFKAAEKFILKGKAKVKNPKAYLKID